MAQLASVIGIYGLTFVAALLAMTPALIWPADQRGLTRRLVPFFLAIVVIAAQVGYGNYRLTSTAVVERNDMRMRLVQPVILEHVDWATADPAAIIERLIELSETADRRRTIPGSSASPISSGRNRSFRSSSPTIRRRWRRSPACCPTT